MSQLIVANIAAPFVLSQTGSIWLFVSIIPVEMLVIFLCLKFSGIAINFSRLFEVVLVANSATSMLGIPLVPSLLSPQGLLLNSPNSIASFISIVLLIGFMFSFTIEAVIYGIFFAANRSFQLSKCQIIRFSLLSNLASYIIFLSALTSLNYNNGGSPFLIPNPQRIVTELRRFVIPTYISVQKDFYHNKNRFAYNREEFKLNEKSHLFFESERNKYSLIYKFYRLDIQGDVTTANFTAASQTKNLKSYRLTIFVIKDKDKDQFIQGICETDLPSMTAPEITQLVDGAFQCSPGSSDTSDQFRLRAR